MAYLIADPEESAGTGTDSATVAYTPASDGNANRAVLFEIIWNVDASATVSSATFGGRSLALQGAAIAWTPASGYAIAAMVLDGSEVGADLIVNFAGALGCDVVVRAWTFGDVAEIGAFQTGSASSAPPIFSVELDEAYTVESNSLVFSGACAFAPDVNAADFESLDPADAPTNAQFFPVIEQHTSDIVSVARAVIWDAQAGSIGTTPWDVEFVAT